MSETTVVCPSCGEELEVCLEVKTPVDRRLEFWIEARDLGYQYACTKCDAKVGEPCKNLSGKTQYNVWPHNDRFVNRMARIRLKEAIQEKWINVR